MKEAMEPAYHFIPVYHLAYVWELLGLPSHTPRLLTPPSPAHPPAIVEEIVPVSPFLHPRARAICDAITTSTPIPDSPLHVAMDLDIPAPMYAPLPATPEGVTIIHCPPTPPLETHDSWCACSPCLAAQDELYSS